jgi:hypothetical protein
MNAWLTAGMAVLAALDPVGVSVPGMRTADRVEPAPLVLAQRASTPDTSSPGSTAPGTQFITRPSYATRQQQYFAAELRRCEAIGEPSERLACKKSVRSKFDGM